MKAVIFDMFETLATLYRVPPYFGWQISQDLGANPEEFYPLWKEMDEDYSKGKFDFETVIRRIGEQITYAHPEQIPEVVKKRSAFKMGSLRFVDRRVLAMLEELKKEGVKIGLLSNCYYEEAEAIHASALAPYFDVMVLSCEVGLQKPEPAIFQKCLEALSVEAADCLYVGDGGSRELEAARALGMQTLQAGWFIKTQRANWRLEDFAAAELPEEVLCKVRQITT